MGGSPAWLKISHEVIITLIKHASTILILTTPILSDNPQWVTEMQRCPFPPNLFSKKPKNIITFNMCIEYSERKRNACCTICFFFPSDTSNKIHGHLFFPASGNKWSMKPPQTQIKKLKCIQLYPSSKTYEKEINNLLCILMINRSFMICRLNFGNRGQSSSLGN